MPEDLRTSRGGPLAAALAGALCALLPAAVWGQGYRVQETFKKDTVPSGINFQGRLEEGGSMVTGARILVFRLWNEPSGGTKLWDSDNVNIDAKDGVFATQLDIPVNALALPGPKYMEISIQGVPLLPREVVRAVPYAKVAGAVVSTIDVRGNSLSITTPMDPNVVLYISSATSNVGLGFDHPHGMLGLSSASARNPAPGVEMINPASENGSGTRLVFNLDPSGAPVIHAAIEAVKDNSPGSSLAFFTRGAGGLGERLRIDRSGYVGIGAPPPLPETTLHIDAAAAPGMALGHDTAPLFQMRLSNVPRMTLSHAVQGGLPTGLLSTVSGDLVLGTGDGIDAVVERMRLRSSGFVGIGLANPAQRLEVAGGVRAQSLESGSDGGPSASSLRLGGDPLVGFYSPGAGSIGFVNAASSACVTLDAVSLTIGTDSATGHILKIGGGDLVIGSPSPLTLGKGLADKEDLFLSGSLVVEGDISASGTSANRFDQVGVATDAVGMELFKVGQASLTVLYDGVGDWAVGLGTQALGVPLMIVSLADVSTMVTVANPSPPGTETPSILFSAGGIPRLRLEADLNIARLGTDSSNPLSLETQSLPRIWIKGTGEVGIGTTNPLTPLDVFQGASFSGSLKLGQALPVPSGGTGGFSTQTARIALNGVATDGTGPVLGADWYLSVLGNAARTSSLVNPPTVCGAGDLYPVAFDKRLNPTACVEISSAFDMYTSTENQVRIYGSTIDLYDLKTSWVVKTRDPYDIDLASASFHIEPRAGTTYYFVGVGTSVPTHKLSVDGDVNAQARFREQGSYAIPTGAIGFTSNTVCPTGWTPYVGAQGRYIVGLVPGWAAQAQVGNVLSFNGENRAAGTHTHGIPSAGQSQLPNTHSHSLSIVGGAGSHGHSSLLITGTGGHLANHGLSIASVNHGHTVNVTGPHTHGLDSGMTNVLSSATVAVFSSGAGVGTQSANSNLGAHGISLGFSNPVNHDHTPGSSITGAGTHSDHHATIPVANGSHDHLLAGTTLNGSATHSHTGTTGGAGGVAGTNAPYVQLLACERSP